jgi:hypothetical protein
LNSYNLKMKNTDFFPECQTLRIPLDFDDFLNEVQCLGDEGKFFAKWLLLSDLDDR